MLGAAFFLTLTLNTLFWGLLIYLLLPFKYLTPKGSTRRKIDGAMVWAAESWVQFNSAVLDTIHQIDWQVSDSTHLDPDKSYLVVANHLSSVDIVVLQKVFNRRIPFLRFFIKRQLFYVPVIGGVWWALNFPFMNRYSREYLKNHPEKRSTDFESVRRSCEKLRGQPVTILNFIEGTRFTEEKRVAQKSKFKNLLTPKAGGIGTILGLMGDQFDAIVDVTIFYPKGAPSLWDLLCGRCKQVRVSVRQLPVPQEIVNGNYQTDAEIKTLTQNWVGALWEHKDEQLELEGIRLQRLQTNPDLLGSVFRRDN